MPRLPTDDLRIRASRPLESPAALARELPLDDAGADFVARGRREVEQIVLGRDARLLVVVGPCSIHDPAAALDYAQRLRTAAAPLQAELLVVMRVYFEKPRTTVGWKGLINDPGLDDSFEIARGLRLARKTMLDLAGLRMPVATEFLDTTLGQYYSDLVFMGGDRRAHGREPGAPRARLGPVDGGRLQEPYDGNVRLAVALPRSSGRDRACPSPAQRSSWGRLFGRLLAWFEAAVERARRSELERFLSRATDHADLERRMREVEQGGNRPVCARAPRRARAARTACGRERRGEHTSFLGGQAHKQGYAISDKGPGTEMPNPCA